MKKKLFKNFLYFGKWNFVGQTLKNSYISRGNFKVSFLKKLQKKEFLKIILYILYQN